MDVPRSGKQAPPISRRAVGTDELRRALTDPDPAVRAAGLDRARLEPHVEALAVRALSDRQPAVRRAAVRLLARLGSTQATRVLMQVAEADLSAAVRAQAIDAIGRLLEARLQSPGRSGL